MHPETLILLLARATALLLAGAAVASLLRRAPAGARHLVWLVTLGGLLALPLASRLPVLRVPVLPAPATPAATTPAAAPVVFDQRVAAHAPEAPRARPGAAAVPVAAGRPLRALVLPAALGIWAAVALSLLAWLAAGLFSARRLLRGARPLEGARWRGLLFEVADRLDLAAPPALLASDEAAVPFGAGVLRPVVVLPAAAEEWDDERLRLVLVHELAHVRRRDLLAQLVARFACALYWFHPLAWAALRRLRAESERACDDFVLACGTRASDYAGVLLDVLATPRSAAMPALAVPMARRRELEGRVLAILDPALRRGRVGRLQARVLLAGLATIFIAVAAVVPSAPAQQAAPVPEPARDDERPSVHQQVVAARQAAREAAVEAAHEAVADAAVDSEDEPEAPRARRSPALPDAQGRALLEQVVRTDPEGSVRKSALWALAQSSSAEDQALFAGALRSDADAEVREMAAWALAEARGDDVAAALAEALRKDASDEVRATAAWALGQRRHNDTAGLLAALGDRSSEVRQAAIWALGQQRLAQAPAPLVSALRDPESEVRVVTAWALGEILDPATEGALRTAFGAERDDEARRAIFRALVLLGDGTAASDLLRQALESKDPELRERAVMMAAGHGPGPWPWPWPWPQPRPMP